MVFFNSTTGILQTLVVALDAGFGIWDANNLLEGYGYDNRDTNARTSRQKRRGLYHADTTFGDIQASFHNRKIIVEEASLP